MSNSINSSGFSGYKGGSSGSSNSGSSSGGRGGSYSPNATFINTDSRQYVKPRSIINVISDIQHYCMAEKLGKALPAEYLTLENALGFFGVGAKSGLTEGLFLLLLLPAVEFYLVPFVLKSPSLFLKTMFGSFPFLPVIANTFLCAYISQYFVGVVTRKAINAFLHRQDARTGGEKFHHLCFLYLAYRLEHPGKGLATCSIFKQKCRGNLLWLYDYASQYHADSHSLFSICPDSRHSALRVCLFNRYVAEK